MKKRILRIFSENLSKFHPDLTDHFMCPVCLGIIPLKETSRISKAHIFPKYAKGNLLTVLCTKCNNDFGSKQDKWFGEFLHLIENNKHALQSRKKTGYFKVNGIKVNGQYDMLDDGPIEFTIDQSRNPPNVFDRVINDLSQRPRSIEISIHSPLQDNFRLVSIGFLTSAYLYWFREFGYSWVFQSHMNSIRQQILEPEKEIIPNAFLLKTRDTTFATPWIGAIDVFDNSAAVMGVHNYLVIFPPANNRFLYEELLSKANETEVAAYERFIDDGKISVEPIGLAYRKSALIFPDHFKDAEMDSVMIYYPGGGQSPQLISKISKEQKDAIKKRNGTVGIDVFFR